MDNKKLVVGDVVEIKNGMTVNAMIPDKFYYSNSKEDEKTNNPTKVGKNYTDGESNFIFEKGFFVVTKTNYDGGGTGMGANDVYPDGYHVFAKRLRLNKWGYHFWDEEGDEIDFYQSGCFHNLITDIKPINRMRMVFI